MLDGISKNGIFYGASRLRPTGRQYCLIDAFVIDIEVAGVVRIDVTWCDLARTFLNDLDQIE
jgi:hypothetical protein